MNFLEKLQSKPRYVRVQILWISVFIFMIVVVSSWVISFKYFDQPIANEEDNREFEALKEVKKEAASVKEAFKSTISAFFEEVEEIEELNELENNQLERQEREIKVNKLPIK